MVTDNLTSALKSRNVLFYSIPLLYMCNIVMYTYLYTYNWWMGFIY